jgi:hypothetical protein
MKKVLALMAVVAMVAISSIAYAQDASDTFTLGGTIGASSTLTVCGAQTLTGNMVVQGYGTSTCTVTAYSNNADGMDLALSGEADGLNTAEATWSKILTSDDTIDETCGAGGTCTTEEWGFRLANATEYGVLTDTDNGGVNAFDAAAPAYHTVNTAAETVSQDADPVADGSQFDIVLYATADADTASGVYAETITVALDEI